MNSGTVSMMGVWTYATNHLSAMSSMMSLASGVQIGGAADNPAGLIAAENLRAALATLEAESRSLTRTYEVASVADAALGEVSGLLVEANSLTLANAGGTLSEAEKQANQMQIDAIFASIDRISRTTSFNGTALLDGSAALSAGGVSLEIDSAAIAALGEVQIDGHEYHLRDMLSGGAINTVDGNPADAQLSLAAAIADVSTQRGKVGSFQSDLVGSLHNSASVAFENISSALSVVYDTNYALETASLVRARLLEEVSLGALSLARQIAARVLSLLGST